MCGICGAVNVDRERPVDPGVLAEMLARLAHRGPDGEGVYTGAGAALGHRRLSIIDLSSAANQPLPNENGTVHAVVNGEIYNHRELRKNLEELGHRFRSRSDSEVVVHLYEAHGLEAFERLEGQFAVAVWDANLETLVLARDRMGEKPLYYHESSSRILFASELRALLADPRLTAAPDDLAIHHYLTFKYVPSPATGIRGIRKLPAGHLLHWERGRASLKRYAALPRPQEAREDLGRGEGGSEEALAERVREEIARAVAARLESDVPIGVLLSGGVDSAIVAYEASRARGGRLSTFTVGFDEADYDETRAAAEVAGHLGTDHHPLRVRPDIAAALPEMVAHFGEPFGDSSAAAVWFLAREVRRHVTVALGGDGGDELFGGYDRHRAIRLYGEMGRTGAATFAPLLTRVTQSLPLTRSRRSLVGRLERFVRGSAMEPLEANNALLTVFSDAQKRSLYTASFGGRMLDVDSVNLLRRFYADSPDPLDDILYADLCLGLPDQLLPKVDIAAMASALEVRSPFLDRDLVRLALALPSHLKVGRRRGKHILRAAYTGRLPRRTLAGRKAGFGLPVDRWMRGPLKEMSRDLLLDARAASRGYFEGRTLLRLLDEHDSGRANHDDRIWALLCLEIWFRTFIDAGSSIASAGREAARAAKGGAA